MHEKLSNPQQVNEDDIEHQSYETLYSVGYHYYKNGLFTKAITVFRFLATNNLKIKKFWLGLAASLQLNKDCTEAVKAYNYTSVLDPLDPFPIFHKAECLIDLQRYDEALETLEKSQKCASKNFSRYDKLIIKIKLLKNSLLEHL